MLASGQSVEGSPVGTDALRGSPTSWRSNEDDFVQVLSGESNPDAEEASASEIAAWCLTGMSGWWSLNIITAELPYFVEELPEGKRLGNLLAVCTQVGNVAPIVYKAVTRNHAGNLVYAIGVFQAVAAGALVACAWLWKHLGILLLCTSVAGSVGCMSSVTYWAATAGRPPACVRAMSVGMTLGGLLATGFSALQLAGRERGDPRFAPSTFFLLAAAMQALQGGVFLARSRAARSQGSQPVDEGNGDAGACSAEEKSPLQAKLLMAGCLFVYGATYTMPTLQPFMAGGYSSATERQQLLLWMLALQNAGDVLGRLATALVSGGRTMLVSWSLLLAVSFLVAVLAAVGHYQVAALLSYRAAIILLPAVCGVYYFSRGLLVTTFYLYARGLGSAAMVQRITVNMGFCGQMGALAANVVAFVVVSAFAI